MVATIREEVMKHQWRIRRQTTEYPDGQRRWDRAYQQLLARSQEARTSGAEPQADQEVGRESSSVREGIDIPAGAASEH